MEFNRPFPVAIFWEVHLQTPEYFRRLWSSLKLYHMLHSVDWTENDLCISIIFSLPNGLVQDANSLLTQNLYLKCTIPSCFKNNFAEKLFMALAILCILASLLIMSTSLLTSLGINNYLWQNSYYSNIKYYLKKHAKNSNNKRAKEHTSMEVCVCLCVETKIIVN